MARFSGLLSPLPSATMCLPSQKRSSTCGPAKNSRNAPASGGTCNPAAPPAPGTVSPAEYEENVKKAALLLKGRPTELLDELRREMVAHSAAEEYERALVMRNEIGAIEHLAERQHVERRREYDQDVIAYQVTEGKVYLTIFNVERGTLVNKQEFTFDAGEDFFEEFLVQYYSEREPPEELILEP